MRLFGTFNMLVLCSMSLISAIKVHQTSTMMYRRLQSGHLRDRTNRFTRRETTNRDSANLLSGNKPNKLFGTVSSQHQVIDDRSTVWPRPIRLRGATETGHSTQTGRVSPEVNLVTTYHAIELPPASINRLHLHRQSQNGHSDGNVMAEHSVAVSQGNIPKPLDETQSRTSRSRLSITNRRDVTFKHHFSFNGGENKRDFRKHHARTRSFNTNTPSEGEKSDNSRKKRYTIQKETSLYETGKPKTFIDFMGISTTSSLGENGFNKDWKQSSNLDESTFDHQHIHADSWSERLLASKGLSSDQFAVSGRDDLSSFPDRRSLKGDSNYFHNVQRSGPHSDSISVQAALIGDNKLPREYFTRKGKLYDDKIHTDKMSSMKHPRDVNTTLKEVFSDNREKSENAEISDSFITHQFPFYEKTNIVDGVGKDKNFVLQLQSAHTVDQKMQLPIELNSNKDQVSNQDKFNQSNNVTCISMLKNGANKSRKVHKNKRRTLRDFNVGDLSSPEQGIKLKSRRKRGNDHIVKLTGVPSKKVIAGKDSVPWEAWKSLTRIGPVRKIETKMYLDEDKESENFFAEISPKFSEDKGTEMSISPGIDLVNEETLLRKGRLQSNTLGKFNQPDKSPDVSAPYRHNARLSREKRATIEALSYAFVYGPKITSLTHTSNEDVTGKNVDHMSKYIEDIQSYASSKKRGFPLKYIARNISKRKHTDRLVLWVRKRRLRLAFIDRLNKEKADMSTSDQIPFKPDGHLGISSDGKMNSLSEAYVEEESNERSDDNRPWQLDDKRSQGSDSLMSDTSVNKEMGKLPDGQYVNSTSVLMDTNSQSPMIPKHLNNDRLHTDNEERGKAKVISIIAQPTISSEDNREENVHSSEEVIMCRSMKDSSLCPTLSPLIDPYVQTLDTGLLDGFSSYTELFHIEEEPMRKHVPIGSERQLKSSITNELEKEKPVDDTTSTQTFESHVATENLDESHRPHLRRRRSESLTSEMPEYEVRPTAASAVETTISEISTQENYFSTTSSGTFHHKKISLIRLNKPSLDLTHIMYLPSSDTSHARDSQLVPWENKDFDDQGRPIIKIGVILVAKSGALFSLNKSRSAIELAGEKIISPKGSLPGYTIQLVFRDSACSEVFGPLAGIDLYMLNLANVYIGPSCDYALAPLARFTPYWAKGIPVLTAGGLVGAFADKNTFQLLTRMQASHTKTSAFLLSILLALGWTTFGSVFYDVTFNTRRPRSDCGFIITEIVTNLEPVLKHKPWFYRFDEKRMENDTLDKVMAEIKNNARIVVLCASPNTVREIMIKAHELNFDNGEYVFFNIDLFSSKNASETPWYRADDTEERNSKARKAYESLMTVTLRTPTSPEYRQFSNAVKARASEMFPNFTYGEDEVNSFVGAFHDAVLLYALALNETLAENGTISDGHAITKRMWNRTFSGITGDVSIDANGDRNADYSLLDLNPETNKFEVVANYFGNKRIYEPVPNKTIHWAGGRLTAPPDTPTCGFDGSKCPPEEPFPEYGIVIIVLGSILLIVLIAVFFIYRHIKLEAELAEMNWRVRWDDILFGAPEKNKKLERQGSRLSLRKGSLPSDCSGDTIAVHLNDAGNRQLFTRTGYYKGAIIAIKPIPRSNITISKPMLLEIKRMKDLQNDHIVRFIGACIDFPNSCILTEYCPKGSLQDVLENEQIKLDWMFRYSIMQDIVRGMAYLQGTEVKSHGYLKSTNCVVDSRFVVKITDFGLHHLRGTIRNSEEDEHSYSYFHNKLWTAPELLRMAYRPPEGTIKGDVYSFAIICQEIVYRNGVFYMQNMDLAPQEIYQKVKMGGKPYFRPTLEEYDCPCDELAGVIRRCWAEDPADRPDFQALKSIIRKLNRDGDKGNILDNLLSRMEQYANNLEALVEERTADYLQQKKKAEDLLYNMLPKKVASQLIRGESVTAEWYDSVSIYFSDICGFTALSAESTPMEVVDLLNDLYTTFDSIIENFDVYKVETIGDAYMVVSGLPDRNGILHAREIARMSLSLLKATLTFRIRHRPKDRLKIRIGIHTGSVCAGVVGLKMPRYCLFGDTVNTASRMESNGLPLKIHVSPQCKEVLDTFGTFEVELRGNVEMKGKGSVKTYWLQGEKITSDSPGVSLNIL